MATFNDIYNLSLKLEEEAGIRIKLSTDIKYEQKELDDIYFMLNNRYRDYCMKQEIKKLLVLGTIGVKTIFEKIPESKELLKESIRKTANKIETENPELAEIVKEEFPVLFDKDNDDWSKINRLLFKCIENKLLKDYSFNDS
jgi:hypothetical protein